MRSGLLSRLFIAAVFIFAAQASLRHPLEHVWERTHDALAPGEMHEEHPFEPVHASSCDVCVAFASLGVAAPSKGGIDPVSTRAGFAQAARAGRFIAAFTPQFRSQAPPARL